MALANLVTPRVAKAHYDDLTQQFELKITFELKTPLGNFPIEYKLKFSDLASLVTAIVNIWAGVAPSQGNVSLAYQFGDIAAMRAWLAGFPTVSEAIPVVGPGYTDLEGYTGPAVPYDGATDTPPWGTTP